MGWVDSGRQGSSGCRVSTGLLVAKAEVRTEMLVPWTGLVGEGVQEGHATERRAGEGDMSWGRCHLGRERAHNAG